MATKTASYQPIDTLPRRHPTSPSAPFPSPSLPLDDDSDEDIPISSPRDFRQTAHIGFDTSGAFVIKGTVPATSLAVLNGSDEEANRLRNASLRGRAGNPPPKPPSKFGLSSPPPSPSPSPSPSPTPPTTPRRSELIPNSPPPATNSTNNTKPQESPRKPPAPTTPRETSNDPHSVQFIGEWKINIPLEKFTKLDRYAMLRLQASEHTREHGSISSALSTLRSLAADGIDLIFSSSQQRLFHGCIEVCEARKNDKVFQPNFEGEDAKDERKKVLAKLAALPANAKHNRNVQIIRAYHGTTVAVAKNILNLGFANLAMVDDGWFGKGIYFTTSPEYAVQYCLEKPDPCILMCYVILFNPYPVVHNDATSPENLRFLHHANYKNFGCHYVPVTAHGKMDFRPPKNGAAPTFDEIVIFNENHILPYALITLKPPSPSSPSVPSTPTKTPPVTTHTPSSPSAPKTPPVRFNSTGSTPSAPSVNHSTPSPPAPSTPHPAKIPPAPFATSSSAPTPKRAAALSSPPAVAHTTISKPHPPAPSNKMATLKPAAK